MLVRELYGSFRMAKNMLEATIVVGVTTTTAIEPGWACIVSLWIIPSGD